MLTTLFYTAAASWLAGESIPTRGFAIAVGEGAAAWDTVAPALDRATTRLASETARLVVPSEAVVFLDESGRPSRQPTPRVRFTVTFPPGQATGTLRECGLFARRADRDALLSYHTHPRIEKEAGASLQRTISLDLAPRAVAPGSRVTRFLGNTYSTELHDLDRETPNCQIAEIRFDRRFYFAGVEQARAAGYDPCAYCFGRDLSER